MIDREDGMATIGSLPLILTAEGLIYINHILAAAIWDKSKTTVVRLATGKHLLADQILPKGFAFQLCGVEACPEVA